MSFECNAAKLPLVILQGRRNHQWKGDIMVNGEISFFKIMIRSRQKPSNMELGSKKLIVLLKSQSSKVCCSFYTFG